jgi:hypothetical protein
MRASGCPLSFRERARVREDVSLSPLTPTLSPEAGERASDISSVLDSG